MKDRVEQIISAYRGADQENCLRGTPNDIDWIIAHIKVEVSDVTMEEIAAALNYMVARDTKKAEIFLRWVEEQRKEGRPERELTLGNCVRELNIWRPNRLN
jgi:hypothetical protein